MIRSFIALPLPDHAAKELSALQRGLPVARAVQPENLHLTLAFLGDQRESTLRLLAEELADLGGRPLEISLSGLTILGGKQPGVIAVNADGGEVLNGLQARVARVVRSVGIDLERRRFRPHVTIFRFPPHVAQTETARIQAWLTAAAGFDPITYRVDTLCLYESRLSKSGTAYHVLADIPFGG
jgi:2'-5' RNA ligase